MNHDPVINNQGRLQCELCPSNHKNRESWRQHIRRSHPEDYEKWKAETPALRAERNEQRRKSTKGEKPMGDNDQAGVIASKDLEIKLLTEKLDAAEKALESLGNAHPSLAAALNHVDTGTCTTCTAYRTQYHENIIKQAFDTIEPTELAKLAVARKAIPDTILVSVGG